MRLTSKIVLILVGIWVAVGVGAAFLFSVRIAGVRLAPFLNASIYFIPLVAAGWLHRKGKFVLSLSVCIGLGGLMIFTPQLRRAVQNASFKYRYGSRPTAPKGFLISNLTSVPEGFTQEYLKFTREGYSATYSSKETSPNGNPPRMSFSENNGETYADVVKELPRNDGETMRRDFTVLGRNGILIGRKIQWADKNNAVTMNYAVFIDNNTRPLLMSALNFDPQKYPPEKIIDLLANLKESF